MTWASAFLLAAACIALFIAYVIWLFFLKKSKFSDIDRALELLRYNARNGGYVGFKDLSTGFYLRYVRYQASSGFGIRMVVPVGGMAQAQRDEVVSLVEGYPYASQIDRLDGEEVLNIDCAGNVKDVRDISASIFFKIMKLSRRAKFKYESRGLGIQTRQ